MSMTLRLKIFIAAFAALISLFEGSGVASDVQSLAILPLQLNAPSGMDYLKGAYRDVTSARIGAGGSIQVEDPAKLQGVIDKQLTSAWSDEAKKSLKETGANFILEGSLSILGDDLSLDVRLVKVDAWSVYPMTYKGKGIGAFTDMLEKLSVEARGVILGGTTKRTMEDIRPVPVAATDKGSKAKGWNSRRLPLALKGIGVADLDNDGTNELAAIDDKNLYIYSFDKDGLKLKKDIKGTEPSWIYSIAVGDFNGNGLPEIYLSRKYMEKAATRIIEFTGKDFAVIADDLPWFIRVVKGPDKALLVGEKFRQIDGLYGGIKYLKWGNGSLEEGGLLDMPEGRGFYGFTIFDATGDGRDDFIQLDDSDRLRLYEKADGGAWKQTWKSYNYYGGSTNNIEFGPAGQEPKAINIKAEILSGRVMEDGRREVIINSNEAGSRVFKNLISYESGEIRGLLWSEVGLEETWRTKKISGYMADYAMSDLNKDKDGIDEIVALVVVKKPSLFSTGESLVVTLSPEIKTP